MTVRMPMAAALSSCCCIRAGPIDGWLGSTGAGRRLSRVIDQEVLLDDFPLEDILDKNDSYAEAGVCSTWLTHLSHWDFCKYV